MTFRQICIVENNQVIITLPPSFENQKQVTVVIDAVVDSKIQKLALLKEASVDPLFLADIEEINKDFDSIDSETV
jgi:molybdopterin biosynthesis enzyme MoaB